MLRHKTVQRVLSLVLINSLTTVPIWSAPYTHKNIDLNFATSELKKIESSVQEFKDLYTTQIHVTYPNTDHLDKKMQDARVIMQPVKAPRNKTIAGMILSGLGAVAGTVAAIYCANYHSYRILRKADGSSVGKRIWSPKKPLAIISGGGALVLAVIGYYSYQQFKKYNKIYAPAKRLYTATKNQKDTLYHKAKMDADAERSLALKGHLNNLVQQTNSLYHHLTDTNLSSKARLLKQKATETNEKYQELDPSFRLLKPTTKTLDNLLIPQYKTIVVETKVEVENEKTKGYHNHQSSHQTSQYSTQSNQSQQTAPQQYQNPYAPPPYNPEWTAEGYMGYPNLAPSAPPMEQSSGSSSNQQSSQSWHSHSSHNNENDQERQKNRVIKVEKRVLDEEKNAQNKQKVNTFKAFYKALESLLPLCDSLRDRLIG